MEWGKAKNILIGVLFVVNLLLAVNLGRMNSAKTSMAEDYLSGSCAILKERGLQVEQEGLSHKKINLPIATIPMREMLYDVARNVLGDVTLAPNVSGEGATFSNGRGDFNIRQGSEFAFEPSSEYQGLERFFREAGYKKKDFRMESENGGAVLQLNGAPVLNFGAKESSREEGPLVTGELLSLEQRKEENVQLLDAVNALFFLAGHLQTADLLPQTILQVEAAYHVTTNAAFNSVTASPVYVITSKANTYYVDAVTGQILDIPVA